MIFEPIGNTIDGIPERVRHLQSQIELVLIPGGLSNLGAHQDDQEQFENEAQHQLRIVPFFLGVVPVTWQQWWNVRNDTPFHFQFVGTQAWPAESVSFELVQQFLQQSGGHLRLPNEWEWEHACRGGNPDPRYGHIQDIAWWAPLNEHMTLQSVGWLKPNNFGLHDMLGMVWEWTSSEGSWEPGCRVLRGGSFQSLSRSLRASARREVEPGHVDRQVGFRVAASVDCVVSNLKNADAP